MIPLIEFQQKGVPFPKKVEIWQKFKHQPQKNERPQNMSLVIFNMWSRSEKTDTQIGTTQHYVWW